MGLSSCFGRDEVYERVVNGCGTLLEAFLRKRDTTTPRGPPTSSRNPDPENRLVPRCHWGRGYVHRVDNLQTVTTQYSWIRV